MTDRQTDRQTDGRATAYSEREREFTLRSRSLKMTSHCYSGNFKTDPQVASDGASVYWTKIDANSDIHGVSKNVPPLQLAIVFTARRNARIPSALLAATAIPSVCLSVCPSVTRRYCVKTTACSTVQFALSDSKMSLVL